MKNFLIKVVVNALAIWVATLVVPGITATGPGTDLANQVLTFLVIGLIFGLVNAVVKPVVALLALPLYILTLGLFSFIVNALMLELTSWISQATPLTFTVDDFFWSAVLGAVVVTFVSMVLNLVLPDRD
ncbi:phage holin family protein [Quadrisphaera sp. GCM10027208]|uniref:phage holin family protein n=1 Tax=Quadrisphaera sp. GCM10027208 TaxID=3273423 RepID=UPI0036243B72